MFNIMLPKINLRVEKWKYNREYEVYVSTLGNFKKKNKKRLPICIGTDGYCRVRTSCGLTGDFYNKSYDKEKNHTFLISSLGI